jgi:hypothetical protein
MLSYLSRPDVNILLQPDRDDADSWIEERMITTALATLNLTPLNRFFKVGASWCALLLTALRRAVLACWQQSAAPGPGGSTRHRSVEGGLYPGRPSANGSRPAR